MSDYWYPYTEGTYNGRPVHLKLRVDREKIRRWKMVT